MKAAESYERLRIACPGRLGSCASTGDHRILPPQFGRRFPTSDHGRTEKEDEPLDIVDPKWENESQTPRSTTCCPRSRSDSTAC